MLVCVVSDLFFDQMLWQVWKRLAVEGDDLSSSWRRRPPLRDVFRFLLDGRVGVSLVGVMLGLLRLGVCFSLWSDGVIVSLGGVFPSAIPAVVGKAKCFSKAGLLELGEGELLESNRPVAVRLRLLWYIGCLPVGVMGTVFLYFLISLLSSFFMAFFCCRIPAQWTYSERVYDAEKGSVDGKSMRSGYDDKSETKENEQEKERSEQTKEKRQRKIAKEQKSPQSEHHHAITQFPVLSHKILDLQCSTWSCIRGQRPSFQINMQAQSIFMKKVFIYVHASAKKL